MCTGDGCQFAAELEMPLVEPLDLARVVNKPIVLKPACTDGLLMSNDNSHLLLTKCHLFVTDRFQPRL
nr:hypothetical protein [Tanacetum cinerariifolium]